MRMRKQNVGTSEDFAGDSASCVGQRLSSPTPDTAGRRMLCAELLARARFVTLSLQNFPVEIVPSHFEETLDKAAFPQPWRSFFVVYVVAVSPPTKFVGL